MSNNIDKKAWVLILWHMFFNFIIDHFFNEFIFVDVVSTNGRIYWHSKNGESHCYFKGFITDNSFEFARAAISQAVLEHPDAVLIMKGDGGFIMGMGGKLLANLYEDELPTDNEKASPLACGLQTLLKDMKEKGATVPKRAYIPNHSVCSLAAFSVINDPKLTTYSDLFICFESVKSTIVADLEKENEAEKAVEGETYVSPSAQAEATA